MPVNKETWLLLDDRELPPEFRHDLDAYLKEKPEVQRLGAFVPTMHGSAVTTVAEFAGVLTTVVLAVHPPARELAKEILKRFVIEWIARKFGKAHEDAAVYSEILDQYGHPCVRVRMPKVRDSKRK